MKILTNGLPNPVSLILPDNLTPQMVPRGFCVRALVPAHKMREFAAKLVNAPIDRVPANCLVAKAEPYQHLVDTTDDYVAFDMRHTTQAVCIRDDSPYVTARNDDEAWTVVIRGNMMHEPSLVACLIIASKVVLYNGPQELVDRIHSLSQNPAYFGFDYPNVGYVAIATNVHQRLHEMRK